MQIPKIAQILSAILACIIVSIVTIIAYEIVNQHEDKKEYIRLEPYQPTQLDEIKNQLHTEAEIQWAKMRQREANLRAQMKERLLLESMQKAQKEQQEQEESQN